MSIITNVSEQLEITQPINENEKPLDTHPCQYCTKPCRGKQCKECHLKMVADRSGKCIDCDATFHAKRQDGTMKKRCYTCQQMYNTTHISSCSGCGEKYHKMLADGRTFEKCYNCYQSSISKCENCDNSTFNGFPLCRDCHQKRPAKKTFEYKKSNIEYETHPCKTDGCESKTSYTFCGDCNYKNKQTSDMYMVSTCQSCGYRGNGDFKFCRECK
jgi:hypothetical protein